MNGNRAKTVVLHFLKRNILECDWSRKGAFGDLYDLASETPQTTRTRKTHLWPAMRKPTISQIISKWDRGS